MILIIGLGVLLGIILWKLLRFFGFLILLAIVVFSCTQLTGCAGGTVGVTQNVNSAGVRTGNNYVAFMGDSITAFWNVSSFYAQSLNEGEPGDTTAMMEQRFTRDVIEATPTPGIVVIDGGIEDLRLGLTSIDNIAKMAQEAQQQDMRVILGAVIPDGTVDPAQIETFNSQLIILASTQGYLYADYYSQFDGDSSLIVNGEPTQAGYDAMWAMLQPLIEEDQR